MVIRVEQCAIFEAIHSMMPGNPQFNLFHQFKIGQEMCLTPKDPMAARITGSLYGTKIENIDVGECSPIKCEASAPP